MERIYKMKKVLLFCAAGMSTSMLVAKMRKAALEYGLDWYIDAFTISDITNEGSKADVILLAPQVRYLLKKVKEQYPEKIVEAIEMSAYGMMNGKLVIEQISKDIEK